MDVSDRGHDVGIRAATAADHDAIVAVWAATGSHYRLQGRESADAFQLQIREFGESYLVAVDGDEIVGVVLGTHERRKGWINRLAVLPGYRRRGIAAALVRACDAALRKQGIDVVCALVESHNQASVSLFRKLGYRDRLPVHYFRKSTPNLPDDAHEGAGPLPVRGWLTAWSWLRRVSR